MAVHSAIAGSNICRLSAGYNVTDKFCTDPNKIFRKKIQKNIQNKEHEQRKMSFLRKTSTRIKETLLGKQRDRNKDILPIVVVPPEVVKLGKINTSPKLTINFGTN